MPLLEVCQFAGASAQVRNLKAELERILKSRLSPDDYALLSGGEVRWVNRAQWVRKYMIQGGLLASNSPRGIWEITPEGEALLQSGDVDAIWPTLTTKRGRSAR